MAFSIVAAVVPGSMTILRGKGTPREAALMSVADDGLRVVDLTVEARFWYVARV